MITFSRMLSPLFMAAGILYASTAHATEGNEEPGTQRPSAGIMTLPVDVIKIIGDHSGNTLALKTVCQCLKAIQFTTKNTHFLMRHSEGVQQLLRTRAAGTPDATLLNLWDDVRTLNCYNLTREDFAILFPDSESVRVSLNALRGNPHTPIKRIILRTRETYHNFETYTPMCPEIIEAINKAGIDLCFIEERYSAKIDSFLPKTPLVKKCS